MDAFSTGSSRPHDRPVHRACVVAGCWCRGPLSTSAGSTSAGRGRSFVAEAEELDDRDPRRGRAVRELILRYGTPSEALGSGPVFVLRPIDETG
jgi:hypothetical protein